MRKLLVLAVALAVGLTLLCAGLAVLPSVPRGQAAHISPTVVATIGVGSSPVGVGVNPNTNRIYVANQVSNDVSVIDGATNAVVATIPVGAGPAGVGVNTTTNRIYVDSEASQSVSVIDGTLGSPTENTVIATIPVPGRSLSGGRGIGVNPVTNMIYVPSFDPGGRVIKIDGATNKVLSQIAVAANPFAAAVNPVTNKIYVGHGSFFGRTRITVIDGATGAVSDGAAVGLSQVSIGVNPTISRIYVKKGDPSRGEPFGVVVVDSNTNTVLATIPVVGETGHGGLGVNPTTNRIYVANSGTNTVSVIDGTPGSSTENTFVATVGVGTSPFVVGVNATTDRVYVSNPGSNTVSVIADDSDGDGVPDDGDNCPLNSNPGQENNDGDPQGDVCDPDDDNDGILDVDDACDNEPEDFDGFQDTDGCPDPDNDGDGILDGDDACPNDPEDFDGFQDDDGCPDPDTTPPVITLTTPDEGAVYTLNQVVLADYACEDEPGGSGLASCVGDVAAGAAIDTASVGPNTFTVAAEDNAGNIASLTQAYSVVYSFSGFFRPVDNPPTLNLAKAGSAIPVKFSLSGNQGLSILAAGYPKSKEISCDTSALLDAIEATVTAGSSSLSYDPIADQYVYVWKTDKAWAGTCRQLMVRLDDLTDHVANFKFK